MPRSNKPGESDLTMHPSHTPGGSTMPTHTIRSKFRHVTAHWLFHGGEVSDEGGLNIQWASGFVVDPVDPHLRRGIALFHAQTTNHALTDDAVNHLYYDGTNALATKITDVLDTEVHIATFYCADGDIVYVHQDVPLAEATTYVFAGLGEMFPSFVTYGLIVSAEAGGAALDVTQSAGHFHMAVHEAVTAVQIDSSATDIWRWYRDGPGTDYTHDACLLYTSPSPRDRS